MEAMAGPGGQIMPPVRGAGAFIMSEMTNVPYFDVAKAAAIPAILYYVGLMAMVHFLAIRHGLQPRPRSELPEWGQILRRAYLALPFLGIVYFLAAGYSPTGAAFYVILITFVPSWPLTCSSSTTPSCPTSPRRTPSPLSPLRTSPAPR